MRLFIRSAKGDYFTIGCKTELIQVDWGSVYVPSRSLDEYTTR